MPFLGFDVPLWLYTLGANLVVAGGGLAAWWWSWRLVLWSLRKRITTQERMDTIKQDPLALAVWTVGGMACVAWIIGSSLSRVPI